MKRTTSVAVGLSLLVLAVAAQAQPAAPKPGPEHKKLEAWVGDWTTEGVGKDDSASPEHKILWTSQARWILGGLFVEFNHLWKSDGKETRGLEIAGYDLYKKTYTSHIFRRNGTAEAANVTFNDRTYVISSTNVADDGRQQKWTCTWILAPDSTSASGKCEVSEGGARWTSFAGKGTKTKAP